MATIATYIRKLFRRPRPTLSRLDALREAENFFNSDAASCREVLRKGKQLEEACQQLLNYHTRLTSLLELTTAVIITATRTINKNNTDITPFVTVDLEAFIKLCNFGK